MKKNPREKLWNLLGVSGASSKELSFTSVAKILGEGYFYKVKYLFAIYINYVSLHAYLSFKYCYSFSIV